MSDANEIHPPVVCRCCGEVIEEATYNNGAAEARILWPLGPCPHCGRKP